MRVLRTAAWAVAAGCAAVSSQAARAEAPKPAPAAAVSASPPAAPLPVDAFYKDPALEGAQLSPNGKFVVAITRQDVRRGVVVYDLTHGGGILVSGTDDKDLNLNWVRWKGSDRLLIGATYLHITRRGGKPDGEVLSWKYSKFVISVDRDGKNSTVLFRDDKRTASHSAANLIQFMDALDNDPDQSALKSGTGLGGPAPREEGLVT